jgi:alpha-tubulin suppressor-like RCC1 family protein
MRGLVDVVDLTAGRDAICVLTRAGKVRCFGRNLSCQLTPSRLASVERWVHDLDLTDEWKRAEETAV